MRKNDIKRVMALMLVLVLALISACGTPVTEFSADTVVAKDEVLCLTLTKITNTGLDFSCENRSEQPIQVFLDIGLDGVAATLFGDMANTRIEPGQTEDFHVEGDLESAEHETMSVVGTVYDPDSKQVVESFDEDALPLGGKAHPQKLKNGKTIYDMDDVRIGYLGAEDDGAWFVVENKGEEPILFGTTHFKYNDDPGDYGGAQKNIPGHTKATYTVRIKDANPDYVAKELIYFVSHFRISRQGEEKVEQFKIEYPF